MARSSYAYVPVLDGLRGLSILMVFIAHIGFEKLVPGGLGVTIFFFISGYIITSLLIHEYKQAAVVDVKAFYIRRLLRLYPPLLFMICIFYSYLLYVQRPGNYHEVLASIFYYENYYFYYNAAKCSSICKVLWSLAVEEHFYLIFPFIFLLLIKKPKALAAVLTILILVPLGFRYFGAIKYAYSKDITERYCYVLTHTRFDSIMYGCLSSILYTMGGSGLYKKLLHNKLAFASALLLIVFCLFYRDNLFRNTLRYSLQGLSLCILIPALVNVSAYQKLTLLFTNRFILLIGKLSYSIYLMHMLAVTSLQFIKDSGHPVWYYLGVTVLTAILAASSYYLVERPFRRFKKRFVSKKQPAISAVPVAIS